MYPSWQSVSRSWSQLVLYYMSSILSSIYNLTTTLLTAMVLTVTTVLTITSRGANCVPQLKFKNCMSCVEKILMCRQHETISVNHACKQVEGYGRIMTETCFILKFYRQNTSNGVQFAEGNFFSILLLQKA